jgi:serine/threonine protein phosphatase 1
MADLTSSPYPPAPPGRVIYAVGDIHGRSDLLDDVFERIDEDHAHERVLQRMEVYLGDYVDRGPDSAGVIARLIARFARHRVVPLRGNHEQMLLDFLDERMDFEQWTLLGGLATLRSYGCETNASFPEPAAALRAEMRLRFPREHLQFLARTHSYAWLGHYLFVHAGIRPKVPMHQQSTAELLTIRQRFLQSEVDHGFVVVHGHTPVADPDFRANRINIDTGAYATNRLSCLKIDHRGVSLI